MKIMGETVEGIRGFRMSGAAARTGDLRKKSMKINKYKRKYRGWMYLITIISCDRNFVKL